MKRSIQELAELVIFAVIAVVVGTALIWVVGWILGIVGILFKFIAGLIFRVIWYLLPVIVIGIIIYFVVRLVQNRNSGSSASSPPRPAPVSPSAASVASAPAVTQASADNKRVVETKVDNAEPIDTDVDTSGYKEVDDLAEDMEDGADDEQKT